MAKILLVEDDLNLGFLLKMQLEHERHFVEAVSCGLDALERLRDHIYDLVIMDWMLPDLTGVDVIRRYRGIGGRTPVLMLTAKGAPEDMATGLDSGADDYLVKPFHPTELGARVRALLRRPASYAGSVLKVQDLELDAQTTRVTRGGREVELTSKEFALLELLMRHPNQSFSMEQILDRLWHADSSASIETVRTHMKTLRKKIGDNEDNSLIRTKRGMGYRIVDQPSVVE
ncbi:MAG TPA: response regulator transcription factor [Candidatus Obscuribacterales bacterium]